MSWSARSLGAPNFIPAIMSFGLWGYLVGHVGIAASVVVAIVFGIIVDDTIHFLRRKTIWTRTLTCRRPSGNSGKPTVASSATSASRPRPSLGPLPPRNQ